MEKAVGIPEERIYFYGKDDNWWIAGEEGPCGPDTEMFFDTGKAIMFIKLSTHLVTVVSM